MVGDAYKKYDVFGRNLTLWSGKNLQKLPRQRWKSIDFVSIIILYRFYYITQDESVQFPDLDTLSTIYLIMKGIAWRSY